MAGQQDYLPSLRQGLARSAGESEHPELWRGLVGAWAPTLAVTGERLEDASNCGRDGTFTPQAALNWAASERGPVLLAAGGLDAPAVTLGSTSPFTRTKDATFWLLANSSSSSNCSAFGSSNSSPRINVHLPYSGTLYWDYGVVASGGRLSVAMPSDYLNAWRQWVFVARGGSRMEVYYEGRLLASGGADPSGFTAAADTLYLGNFPPARQGFAGMIGGFAAWSRAISPDEVWQLYCQPHALFVPRRVCGSPTQRRFTSYRRLLASNYGISP